MSLQAPTFLPAAVYGTDAQGGAQSRVLLAPPRYIQGADALQRFGGYCQGLNLNRVAVLASLRGHSSQAGVVIERCGEHGIQAIEAAFGGECSLQEIEQHAAGLKEESVDALIAVGGGKCVDAGKCIAQRLNVPVIIVPTLASNDAPCSALSVTYSDDGVVVGAEFFPLSPLMVVVDTSVIAQADERFLVAGMGDAMATWYEARVCRDNPAGRTVLGARPTNAAVTLGHLCAQMLYDHGEDACCAVRDGEVTPALEDVVEANTLLSGVGFESGGLAGAHAYAQGYTTVPRVERNYLHGEMVGMGVVAQLVMESNETEAKRVAEFFARIGLPIVLSQLGLSADDKNDLDSVVAGAMTFQPLANFPFEVTPDRLLKAMLAADELGSEVMRSQGDMAYRRLQKLSG